VAFGHRQDQVNTGEGLSRDRLGGVGGEIMTSLTHRGYCVPCRSQTGEGMGAGRGDCKGPYWPRDCPQMPQYFGRHRASAGVTGTD
jgi:hypothetical protein